MGLRITVKPEISKTFTRLKKWMDKYVYDTKDTAIPNFKEIKLEGTGANAGEYIQIFKNHTEQVLVTRASSRGTFEVTVPVSYERSNTFHAYGGSSGKSNVVVFDVYNWLLFFYLYSQEFLRIIQKLGQAKQDLYIDDTVGDTLQPIFETEKDRYETSWQALKDKFTLPIPTDYWGKDIKKQFVAARYWICSSIGGIYNSRTYCK